MFNVICDITAQCCCNRFFAFDFFNAKKMICALMIIISNHNGIKYFSNLFQLEPFNDLFKVISDLMAHCYDM